MIVKRETFYASKPMLRPLYLFPSLVIGLLLMLPSVAFGQQCIEDVFCVIAEEHEGVVDFYVDNFQDDDLIVILDVDADNMIADVSFPHLATFLGNKRTHAFRIRRRHPQARWQYTYRFLWRKAVNQLGCQEDLFCIEAEENDRFIEVFVENKQPYDLTVELGMKLENATTEATLPHTATYLARARTPAFRIQRTDKFDGVRYAYSYRWTYGRLDAEHDDAFAYALPYAPGKAFAVGQGFGGDFSHRDTHAIDWNIPERTPVHAARGGIVVAVEDHHTEGGLEERLRTKANHILIQHDDGTIGNYAHLASNGVFVRIGQRVRQGQAIGVSGNTGYSSGAHLHFEVFLVVKGLIRQTVPIRFRVEGNRVEELIEGKSYMAPLR